MFHGLTVPVDLPVPLIRIFHEGLHACGIRRLKQRLCVVVEDCLVNTVCNMVPEKKRCMQFFTKGEPMPAKTGVIEDSRYIHTASSSGATGSALKN